jgi:hypothetical protein
LVLIVGWARERVGSARESAGATITECGWGRSWLVPSVVIRAALWQRTDIPCDRCPQRDRAANVLLVRRVGGAVLAVLVAVLASACSGPSVPPTSAQGRPDGVVELPPRPREVRLDGVDPCSLLTGEQRVELGLDARPVFSQAPVGLYPGGDVPACDIGGFEPRAVAVGISLVTTVGIERFTDSQLAAEIRPVSVQGFPAVVAVPTRFSDYCSVIVDVAPGQLVDVQFATGGREPPIPQPQLCRDAELVAVAAMTTLLKR